jgi:hypothetical protein
MCVFLLVGTVAILLPFLAGNKTNVRAVPRVCSPFLIFESVDSFLDKIVMITMSLGVTQTQYMSIYCK